MIWYTHSRRLCITLCINGTLCSIFASFPKVNFMQLLVGLCIIGCGLFIGGYLYNFTYIEKVAPEIINMHISEVIQRRNNIKNIKNIKTKKPSIEIMPYTFNNSVKDCPLYT